MGDGGEHDELRELVTTGARRIIYAYRDLDGTTPALEFLEKLDETAQARYLRRFQVLSNAGRLDGTEYHPLDSDKDKEAAGLSEFKDISSKTRILAFSTGEPSVLVLSHGFQKKENKLGKGEILTAMRHRLEYIARRAKLAQSCSPGSTKKPEKPKAPGKHIGRRGR